MRRGFPFRMKTSDMSVEELLKVVDTWESDPTWQKIPTDVRQDQAGYIYRDIAEELLEKAEAPFKKDKPKVQSTTSRKPRFVEEDFTVDEMFKVMDTLNNDPIWQRIPVDVKDDQLKYYWREIGDDAVKRVRNIVKPPPEKPAKRTRKGKNAE